MANPPKKRSGNRIVTPPPLITHAPHGLAGGPPPRRMRSLAVALGAGGAAALGAFAVAQSSNRGENCHLDASGAKSGACDRSGASSSTHNAFSSGFGGSGGGHVAVFGGFGESGFGHLGGGLGG